MPRNRLGGTWGKRLDGDGGLLNIVTSDGETIELDQLTAEERRIVGIDEVGNSNIPQNQGQNNIVERNVYSEQLNSIETGTPIQIEPDIVNIWNEFRNSSTMDLSNLTPFAVVFLVVSPSILNGLGSNGLDVLGELKWYKADIKGYGKTVVFPIAATKNIFETTNFQGGLGISQFNIGWEGNTRIMRGSFSFNLLSLDEFDQNFVAAAMLSPYNTVLTVHGWSGPGIWIDLPFNLEQGSEWKTQIESINPGLWSNNLMKISQRVYTPDETGYSCECSLIQHSTAGLGSSDVKQGNISEQFKSHSNQSRHFITGSSQTIQDNLIDKSKLLSKLENIYKDSNLEYIKEKLNSTWFSSQKEFVEKYSLKRVNEDGINENVSDVIFYPLGLVTEAIIAAHYEKNPLEPLMNILYESTTINGDTINIPNYTFSLYDGENSSTFEIPIKSAFDIPIPRKKIEKILQKPDTQWKDAIYEVVSSVKNEYRLLHKGINRTLNGAYLTFSLEFAEQKIDKEISKSNVSEINEDLDFILEYRSQNSLMGPVSLETSNINLEAIAALGFAEGKFGLRNTIFLDSDTDDNKEVNAVSTKQPTNEDERHDYIKDDITNGIENAELITNLYANDSSNRGFLLRLLSQMVSTEIHGISGLIPMQMCWVRGLTKGLNGKHLIWTVKENITSQSFTVSLQLINLNYAQDNTGIQNDNENSVQDDTTNPNSGFKKLGQTRTRIKTGVKNNSSNFINN